MSVPKFGVLTVIKEWTRTFSLIDPSCMEDDVDVVNRSFLVNCFQKKHIEWLPQAEIGDIVLFRRLKVIIHSLCHFKLLKEFLRPPHSVVISMVWDLGISCVGSPMIPIQGVSVILTEKMLRIPKHQTKDLGIRTHRFTNRICKARKQSTVLSLQTGGKKCRQKINASRVYSVSRPARENIASSLRSHQILSLKVILIAPLKWVDRRVFVRMRLMKT